MGTSASSAFRFSSERYSAVGEELIRPLPTLLFNHFHHRLQLFLVVGCLRHVLTNDQLKVRLHRRLRVVALREPVRAFHDPRFRIGEIVLVLLFRFGLFRIAAFALRFLSGSCRQRRFGFADFLQPGLALGSSAGSSSPRRSGPWRASSSGSIASACSSNCGTSPSTAVPFPASGHGSSPCALALAFTFVPSNATGPASPIPLAERSSAPARTAPPASADVSCENR